MRHALVIGQRHTLLLLGRQLAHAVAKLTHLRGLQQQIQRSGVSAGHGCQEILVVFAIAAGHRGADRRHLGAPAAQGVDGAIARDADEPGHRLGTCGIEALGGAPDVDKDVLQEILGLRFVGNDTQDDPEEMRAGYPVDRGQCRTIAKRDAGQRAGQCVAAVGPVI